MTLPTNIVLPLHTHGLKTDDPEAQERYFRELTFSLQRMYEDLAQGINGDIRADYGNGRENWTPTLKGTTLAGTFTYAHQSGWALRQGLITDVWFDVQWSSAGTATGNLYVELPYKVALSTQKPMAGVVQSSAFTYTGGTGIVINGIGDTYRGELWNVGDGFTTANQGIVASGQIIGHLRYIGVQNESA